MKTRIQITVNSIVLALLLVLGVAYVQAWTGPGAAAPTNNVAAPINVGGDFQSKAGSLDIGGTFSGTVGVLTNSLTVGSAGPSAGLALDIAGKVGATEYCDQNGSNCTPASAIAADGLDIVTVHKHVVFYSSPTIDCPAGYFATGVSGIQSATPLPGNSGYKIDNDSLEDYDVYVQCAKGASGGGGGQAPLTSSCAVGSSIRGIAPDGTVTCEPGVTTYNDLPAGTTAGYCYTDDGGSGRDFSYAPFSPATTPTDETCGCESGWSRIQIGGTGYTCVKR